MENTKDEFEELQQKLRLILPTLKPNEQEVLKMRFGLENKYAETLEAVGKHFSMSKGDIRKIELKAFWNIKKQKRNLDAANKAYGEEKYKEAFGLYEKVAEQGNAGV